MTVDSRNDDGGVSLALVASVASPFTSIQRMVRKGTRLMDDRGFPDSSALWIPASAGMTWRSGDHSHHSKICRITVQNSPQSKFKNPLDNPQHTCHNKGMSPEPEKGYTEHRRVGQADQLTVFRCHRQRKIQSADGSNARHGRDARQPPCACGRGEPAACAGVAPRRRP